MQIGELNRRVTIEYQTRVGDGMGGYVTSFSTLTTVWAKSYSVSSTELSADLKVNMVRIQKFVIRYLSVFRPDWRIKYGDRYFAITGIDPDSKNEYIYLTCKEAVL